MTKMGNWECASIANNNRSHVKNGSRASECTWVGRKMRGGARIRDPLPGGALQRQIVECTDQGALLERAVALLLRRLVLLLLDGRLVLWRWVLSEGLSRAWEQKLLRRLWRGRVVERRLEDGRRRGVLLRPTVGRRSQVRLRRTRSEDAGQTRRRVVGRPGLDVASPGRALIGALGRAGTIGSVAAIGGDPLALGTPPPPWPPPPWPPPCPPPPPAPARPRAMRAD
jgi:hypothetical protein